jgi:hypothetical protein
LAFRLPARTDPPAVVEIAVDSTVIALVRVDAGQWVEQRIALSRAFERRGVTIGLAARDPSTGSDRRVLVGRLDGRALGQ